MPESPDGPDAALASALRALRIEKGLTQEAFAYATGVTVKTVGRIERGVGDPSWATMRRFAQTLDLTTMEFVARIEQERQNQR